MKKFQWPLQRLLHVTEQRERAMRLEVMAVLQQVRSAERQISRRQGVLRDLLAGLGRQTLQQRLPLQQVFLSHSRWEERVIAALQRELQELRTRREQMTAQLMQLRSSRKSLERLRAEELRKYLREQERAEQKQMDESAQVAFAAKAAGWRLAQP